MTEKFKVGEVAIYVRKESPYYGKEVIIVCELSPRPAGYDKVTGKYREIGENGYVISIGHIDPVNGKDKWFAFPEWLRKKKLPSRTIDQVTSWDKCLWKPRGLVNGHV